MPGLLPDIAPVFRVPIGRLSVRSTPAEPANAAPPATASGRCRPLWNFRPSAPANHRNSDAIDAAGNVSPRSGLVTFTTPTTGGPGFACWVAYTTNIREKWGATWPQAGASVVALNLSYNGNLAPSQSVDIGFNGGYSGSNTRPALFAINGVNCAVG